MTRYITIRECRYPNPDGLYDLTIAHPGRRARRHQVRQEIVDAIDRILFKAGIDWLIEFIGGEITVSAAMAEKGETPR